MIGIGYGWRGRMGIILPSPNTTAEPEYWMMVPEGVSVHTARMHLRKVTLEEHEAMERDAAKAATDLATAKVDVIVYSCTSGSFYRGLEGERELSDTLREKTGLPIVTTARAVVDALKTLGAMKIVLATPYPKEWDEMEKAFLEACGFEVLRMEGLGIDDAERISRPTPEDAYQLAKRVFTPEADAIFISCANFRSAEVIDPLEKDLGRPVVTSVQASVWAGLRAMGISAKVHGYGRLLEDHLTVH